MSTILTAATKRDWSNLTTNGLFSQEEIQMLRVGDALFIAANKGGHTAVQGFLKAFGVCSAPSFIDSLKWANAIVQETKPTNWQGDIGKRLSFSVQDKVTIDLFAYPDGLPKTPTQAMLKDIYNCVGKPGKKDAAPTTRKDWKTGPLQYLLGIFKDSKAYVGDYAKPSMPAKVQGGNFTSTPKMDYAVTVITEKAVVHAELKLLAVLTRLIIEGKVEAKTVQLGGAKGACKECAKWINTYSEWLSEKGITLQLPENDTRPSADPAKDAWNNPAVDQTFKDSIKGLSIVKLFD